MLRTREDTPMINVVFSMTEAEIKAAEAMVNKLSEAAIDVEVIDGTLEFFDRSDPGTLHIPLSYFSALEQAAETCCRLEDLEEAIPEAEKALALRITALPDISF